MTFSRLALAGLVYYRRTHAAVVLGVAGAVAVLAGSLLVGTSVRESLASLATSRLGRTSVVVAAELPFTEDLSDRLSAAVSSPAVPVLSFTGVVRHESSSRRAGDVRVFGVDDRFFAFHGVSVPAPGRTEAWLSPDLAAEFGASAGDAIVVRLARPTDIPLDSLHGRREDVGRSIRLTSKGTLGRDQMGEFSLAPGQGPARAVFVSMDRLQRDLELPDRVNTILLSGTEDLSAREVRRAVDQTATASDLGVRIDARPESDVTIVESASGLVSDTLASRVTAAAGPSRRVTSVLTWLATRLTVGDRTVPYSLVTAISADAAGDRAVSALLSSSDTGMPPVVLNAWAMRELGAEAGDVLDLEYYRWADEGRLVTERAQFRVAGTVPMSGLAVDRRLAPDYPGITTATNVTDWDPPFPIDLDLILNRDEEYWDQYRTAPKAFIPLAAGQKLWRTRHGQITSLRVAGTEPVALGGLGASSVSVVDVRRQNLAASTGATDFGAYFSYFSFFLMASALLLAALFFRLSVEQRLPQIGVLRASGFPLSAVRRAWLMEGVVVAGIGAAIGAGLAVAWAGLMMFALRTWWVDAVGTTRLVLHVDPMALVIGAAGAGVVAIASIAWTIRSLSRSSPRALMAGSLPSPRVASGARARWIAPAAGVLALLLAVASLANVIPAVGGFFGAGALVLIAGLAATRAWLGASRSRAAASLHTVAGLALRNASWRPGRSLTAAGLVAAAVFLLVSVDSFRKSAGDTDEPASGTGGFALIAESALPIVHDLQSPDGREAAGFPAAGADSPLADATIFSLRLRPGDDASCLNLYQPKQPRVVGVPAGRLANEGRFRFARTIASATDAERANPWTLLKRPDDDGVVPAIVDQTSLQYVLHAAVGDVITIDADTSRPIQMRVVASLDDSVLQGEILIGEPAFQQVFPDIAGYRVFLIALHDPAPARADAAAQALEEALDPFGFDAQSAVARLDAFHRVENTYLSTFQALGGLGLVLGCLGLVAVIARNVLERRRELALLGAAGFTGRDLQRLVAIEHLVLVGVGLAIGVAAAALAIAPVLVARGGGAPWAALVWLAPVAAAGLAAAYGATRNLRRLPLVASLRSE